MATKTECRSCKKKKDCPVLEAIKQEEIFRAACNSHKDKKCQKK